LTQILALEIECSLEMMPPIHHEDSLMRARLPGVMADFVSLLGKKQEMVMLLKEILPEQRRRLLRI